MDDLTPFLEKSEYVDYSSPNIQALTAELFANAADNIEKSKIAYEFVRDNIPHSNDINADVITIKASDVLLHKTGICHAKSNLLAALLRSQGIPAGFCFQRLTLADDDSKGYCLHCYNAIYLDNRWIYVDARGNKPGVNAQFSMGKPVLAFRCRPEYDEYFLEGIFSEPHPETMRRLNSADNFQEAFENLPDSIR